MFGALGARTERVFCRIYDPREKGDAITPRTPVSSAIALMLAVPGEQEVAQPLRVDVGELDLTQSDVVAGLEADG